MLLVGRTGAIQNLKQQEGGGSVTEHFGSLIDH